MRHRVALDVGACYTKGEPALRGTLTAMRASLRTTSLAFARAAAVRGAPVAAGATAANRERGDHPSVEAEHDVEAQNMAARAAYRAWRQGGKRYSHHHGDADPEARLHRALFGELRSAKPPPLPAAPPRILSDFSSPSLIGKGGFGFVYAASSECDGHRYALKVLPCAVAAQSPPAEAQCMASLPPHGNLVRYHGSWREPRHSVRALRAALDGKQSSSLEASDSSAASGRSLDEDEEEGLSDMTSDVTSDTPSSRRKREVYTASLEASEAATISASQDESATDFCFFEPHAMAAELYMNTKPEVECFVAQSESVWP